ncbi:MAG: heparinase II/III family protein [Verrucomicrobia bacterium]|nr:heparinase II/III family protein [Verrucomicrobiota bacterium]
MKMTIALHILATVFLLSATAEIGAAEMKADAHMGKSPMINGHAIDPTIYRDLIEHKFLPTRATFLSNEELAQKFDLSLGEMGDVKAALDKHDPTALQTALIGYLNRKLPPLKPANPPKSVIPGADNPEMRYRPDAWLGKEIPFNVNDKVETFEVGEGIDWFKMGDGFPDFAGWSSWGNILSEAYLASGDPKYAQGILMYARSFYKNCRPPEQVTTSWSGALGPWAVGGRGRATGLLQWVYQVIAASPVTTDEGRLMFLKMIYEHADEMYRFSEQMYTINNFEFYPISVLTLLARQFPEFKDAKKWKEHAAARAYQSMEDSLLDDGGPQERHEYAHSYLVQYTRFYTDLVNQGAKIPDGFRQKLEKTFEWFMYIHSPLYQWPQLNIGSMNDSYNYIVPAAELFPKRDDLVFYATKGAKGKSPARTARVMAHSGFLTMRSDWSSNALYMAVNYNATLPEISGTYPDMLSFGLWSHGRPYLTNAGTPVSYANPRLLECTHTKSSNTVTVDGIPQEPIHNSGRLENWQDRTGFTYFSSANENYRQLGVRHRRAILFMRPRSLKTRADGYWVVFDRLTPHDRGLGKIHEYWWRGHFQPMEMTVDATTKTAASSVVDGKRLYIVPGQPEQLAVDQSRGLIADGVHSAEQTLASPIISYNQKSDKPVSYTVALCPTINNAPAPALDSLPIQAGKEGVRTDNATGVRVHQGSLEDVVVMAETPGLRAYGSLTTDGEAACVRTENGKILEAGLVGGQKLVYAGQTLVEVGSEIASADIHYGGEKLLVDIRGNGKISMPAGSEKIFVLNGTPLSGGKKGWWWKRRWEVDVKSAGPLEIISPSFSTDPEAVFKAYVGFRPNPTVIPPYNPVLVSWKTSLPADATVDYAPVGTEIWVRNTKPDAVTDHRIVIHRMTPGTSYRIRIQSRTEDDRVGKAELTHQCVEVKGS